MSSSISSIEMVLALVMRSLSEFIRRTTECQGRTLVTWLRVPDTRAVTTPPCSRKRGGVVAIDERPGFSRQIEDGL